MNLSEAVHLSSIDSEYPLTDAHREAFQSDGFVLLRGVAHRDDTSRFRRIAHEVLAQGLRQVKEIEERHTFGRAYTRAANLWEVSEQLKNFVYRRRFAQIAGELMGVDGVRLYHDQVLFKESGSGETPWHQDQGYWPLEPSTSTATMWMPLVQSTPDMGNMRFAIGSHKRGPVDLPDSASESWLAELGYAISAPEFLNPGDAIFHAGWTIHSVSANITQSVREVATITYFEAGANLVQPASSDQMIDLELWFPECEIGGPAASRLNPILFSRFE